MAWQRRWWINSKSRWVAILRALLEFDVNFAEHPIELIAREAVEPLSPPQRRLFHAICQEAAPHFGLTPAEYKEEVRRAYFGDPDNLDRLIDLLSGVKDGRYSTEDLEHEHYHWLIECAYRLAAENGLYIPDRRPK